MMQNANTGRSPPTSPTSTPRRTRGRQASQRSTRGAAATGTTGKGAKGTYKAPSPGQPPQAATAAACVTPSLEEAVTVPKQRPNPPLRHARAASPRVLTVDTPGAGRNMRATPQRYVNLTSPSPGILRLPGSRDLSPPAPRQRSPPRTRDRTPPPPRCRSPPRTRDMSPPAPRPRSPLTSYRTPHTWSGATVMTSPHGQLPTPFSENALQAESAGAASAGQPLPAGRPPRDPIAVREMTEVKIAACEQDMQNEANEQKPGLRQFPSRSDVANWRKRQQQGENLAWTPRPNQGGVGAAGRSEDTHQSIAGEPMAHSMHPTPSSTSNGEVGAAGRTGGSGLTGGPRHISIACSGHSLTSPLTEKVNGDSLTSPITDTVTEPKVIGDSMARLSVTFESEIDSEATSLTPSLTQATTEAATVTDMLESLLNRESRPLTTSLTSTTTDMPESLLNRESRPLTTSLTSTTTEQPVSSVSYADLALRRGVGLAAYQPPPLPVIEPPSQADVLSRIPVRNLPLNQDSVNQLSRRERRHQRWEQNQQRLAEQRRALFSDPASARTPSDASVPALNPQHQSLMQNQMMLEVSEYMQNLHQQVLQHYPHLTSVLPAVGAPPMTPYQHTLGWASGLPSRCTGASSWIRSLAGTSTGSTGSCTGSTGSCTGSSGSGTGSTGTGSSGAGTISARSTGYRLIAF
ncbi:hypothetical protein CYMTET_33397 [Cymbomonas tetramitiformis]|uniref:Uncharacterized protein n=1 Tax=Cymbomonas tetramitiformis TaxID=36881 RepID=A0AAE0KQX8_9CHLO|nr:hypothetical protein CYMTET_33397 [Cymbomonas tetramitiformis]